MCSLGQIISAALLATPVDARSPAEPHLSVAFAYVCDPDGHPQAAWGRLAAHLDLDAHFERGVARHFDSDTLPSYNNVLTSLGYNLYSSDHQDDVKDTHPFAFFPRARVSFCKASSSAEPALLAVQLLEIKAGQQTVGVAIMSQGNESYREDHSSSIKLHWHCLHPQANVRLCALLALRGVARMANIKPASDVSCARDIDETVEQVVVVFERELKHSPAIDLWSCKGNGSKAVEALMGRERFASTVRYFVERNQSIPFVLPAFPCKSSNKAKTSGDLPDKGEDLAAQTLASFARGVQKVYAPGATVHVVSDGHTFADLIGVDGSLIDKYTMALQKMFERHDTTGNTFFFHGLEDLLPMLSVSLEPRSDRQRTAMPAVLRVVLSALWGPYSPRAFAQASDDRVRLMQGLSRFLLEDLEELSGLQQLSRKKRKRVVMDVAIQMIARNEAYSQLVEISFPGAVRLSIHPHDNRGPKYGVSLLHPRLRSSMTLSKNGDLVSDQSAGHTPTPWHNATLLVQEGGESRFVLMHRAKLMQLQPSPAHELVWVPMFSEEDEEPSRCNEDGGYFYFKQPVV